MVDSARTGQSDGANAPTRAGGEVEVWSTDAVPLRERFSYWREVVCTAARGFFGTPTEAPPGTFSACVAIRICGSFRIMTVESKTGFQFARTRRDMANTPPNHYGFYLQLNGGMSSIRGEESTKLLAGDIGFCQGPEYRAQFGGRCAIVKLPRPMIERRAPWLLDRAQGKLAPAVRFANHVRLHMLELTNGTPPLGESQTTMLADSLCNLIALAAADGIPATRLQPELQLEALLAFCRQNLSDPDLSPQQAADHVGISLGTLHSRFRQTGRTFGHWVLENRLEGCSVALRDPHQRHQNISEVAYRWGFNDLSYFSKAFRAQFDMTPGEWRQGLTPSWSGRYAKSGAGHSIAERDRAYSQYVVMNIVDKLGVYWEVARVLKPDGRLVLCHVGAGANGQPDYPLPWAGGPEHSFLASDEETRRDLEHAGLQIISFRDTTQPLQSLVTMRRKLESEGMPAVGSHVLAGEHYLQMLINTLRASERGQIRTVEVVAFKRRYQG